MYTSYTSKRKIGISLCIVFRQDKRQLRDVTMKVISSLTRVNDEARRKNYFTLSKGFYACQRYVVYRVVGRREMKPVDGDDVIAYRRPYKAE